MADQILSNNPVPSDRIPCIQKQKGLDRRNFLLALPAAPLAAGTSAPEVQDSPFLSYAIQLLREGTTVTSWPMMAVAIAVVMSQYSEGNIDVAVDKLKELGYQEFGCSSCHRKDLPQAVSAKGRPLEVCQDCMGIEAA